MKNYLLFLVVFCLEGSVTINAQKRIVMPPFARRNMEMAIIDSGNVRVWYALNAVDIYKPETYDDLQRLEIGSHISKYFSHFVYNSDSLCAEWRKQHKEAQTVPSRMGSRGKNSNWSEYYYAEYFKDFSTDTFTEYARMARYIPNYQYEESIPVQNWEIHDDTLAIAGHLCQKADCLFRGRNYTAWFTLDIPVNNGPWKFGGLPGLILKVYDKDGEYVFECIKVEVCPKKYPIKIYDYKDYRKIERKKLLQLQKESNEDYIKKAGLILREGTPPPPIPYYPLELE